MTGDFRSLDSGDTLSSDTFETCNVFLPFRESGDKRKAFGRPGMSGDAGAAGSTHKKERNRWEAGEHARASSIFLDRNNLDPAKELLNAIVRDPQLLFDPDLKFVKNFLLHFGLDLPRQSELLSGDCQDDAEAESQHPESSATYQPGLHGDENECEEDDYVEEGIDDKLLPPENDPMPPMGRDLDLEPSEQDFERAAEHRLTARQASDENSWSVVIDELTAALQLAPSSLLYAQRAAALLSAQRPLAALRDCEYALNINPDSAK
eukprot:scaffold135326_cov36-Prasinocladus_malaysianus.AAC.1